MIHIDPCKLTKGKKDRWTSKIETAGWSKRWRQRLTCRDTGRRPDRVAPTMISYPEVGAAHPSIPLEGWRWLSPSCKCMSGLSVVQKSKANFWFSIYYKNTCVTRNYLMSGQKRYMMQKKNSAHGTS